MQNTLRHTRALWVFSMISINSIIFLYLSVATKVPEASDSERYKAIQELWPQFNLMWRIEFILMLIMTIAMLRLWLEYKNLTWTFITLGNLILLLTYPIMLGGYHNTSVESYSMAFQVSVLTFITGNILLFIGYLLLYLYQSRLPKILNVLGIALSAIGLMVFLASYTEFLTFSQTMQIGPLITLLFLLNAWWGWKEIGRF